MTDSPKPQKLNKLKTPTPPLEKRGANPNRSQPLFENEELKALSNSLKKEQKHATK